MNEVCVVFVCNKAYFDKFLYTCYHLLTKGNYKGNICLVIGDDLKDDEIIYQDFIIHNNIYIQHFPDIKFPDEFIIMQHNLYRPQYWSEKLFQYHKLHLFNTFFKQWKYIFYIDCGTHILSNIQPILNLKKKQ